MKSLIGVENVHIFEINLNHVQIFGDINGMVDPEVYFEIKINEGVCQVSQVSRGQEIEAVSFKNELYAYLYLGL